MNHLNCIAKLLTPLLKCWVLVISLWLMQPQPVKAYPSQYEPALEQAYLIDTDLAHVLDVVTLQGSDEAVMPGSPAQVLLCFFILLSFLWATIPFFYNKLKVTKYINAYTRNTFYVFVSFRAP